MYGVIVLAAGNSKRMNSDQPKVLHKLAGTPILIRILKNTLDLLNIHQVIVVAGNNIALLKSACKEVKHKDKRLIDHISWVQQDPPKGTADAVAIGLSKIQEQITKVIIISGDLPLIATNTLNNLINNTPDKAIGLITSYSSNPFGLGRIKRNSRTKSLKIIEEKDATSKEKKINETNVGLYLFPKTYLAKYLPKINNNNNQKEYYLTDLFNFVDKEEVKVITINLTNNLEGISINTKKQLIELERAYQIQQAFDLLDQGVMVRDPYRLDIRGEINVAKDVEIDINVILDGTVSIAMGSKIGANCYIKNTIIKENVIIHPNSFIEGATINAKAIIGPFARIRPNTEIGDNAKIGNFVEIKASSVGDYSKINHLSYVGDAKVGHYVNIGAGTITCNYDGVNKHITVIEDGVSVGAGCQLIAPITLEQHAVLAAGTTLIQNAPAAKLTLNKKIQYSIEWQQPIKAAKDTEYKPIEIL